MNAENEIPYSDLQREIKKKFEGLPDEALIRRLEQGEAFNTDDEEVELTRRLAEQGMEWRYFQRDGQDVIAIYYPEPETSGEEAEEVWSTDIRIINASVQEALEKKTIISDAAARMIAAQWHGGQSSALYSFVSTGAVDREELTRELDSNLNDENTNDDGRAWLLTLKAYLEARTDVGPVKGWHKLWIEESEL